jgi:hypothetical protein
MNAATKTRQLRRWWWLPPFVHRMPDSPSRPHAVDHTTDYQPSPIPASNGHTPTAIGRTQSMLSPVKAITAGAIVFAIGGAFLVTQPIGQQAGNVPAAESEGAISAPVEFTAHVSQATDCFSRDSEAVVDGVEQIRGTRCRTAVEDSTDPRFSGTWLFVHSEDGYGMGPEVRTATGEGAPTVWTVEYRVENDDGAWQSGPVSGIEFAEREMMVAPVFTGEGAYEGLTAIVEMSDRETDIQTGSSDATLRGAIFGGSPPPPSGFPANE